jgi:hypothetical protein
MGLTKEEDIWSCYECGELKGRHDLWFEGDICEDCNSQIDVLVGCEESQAITKELRVLGIRAFSCDLLPCSGGHDEWHIQGDVFQVIYDHPEIKLGIFHPPCTFLSSSGAGWLYHPDDKDLPTQARRPHPKYPNRIQDRDEAVEFVKRIYESDIPHIAIENPIGSLSSQWRKPNQIVHPWMFGDEANKATCFWLKGLPLLTPTNVVGKGEFFEWVDGKSGKLKRQPMWYYKALSEAKTPEQRRTLRSKTFQGMAKAIAYQWSQVLK